jgi:hypothetical protein
MATVIDVSGHNPKSPASNTSRFFKRAYQACNNCRRRKIKCIIECDKEGHLQPTCVRCKRELRQCTFNADRRTQVTAESYTYGSQRTVQVIEGIDLSPSDKQLQYVRRGISEARSDLSAYEKINLLKSTGVPKKRRSTNQEQGSLSHPQSQIPLFYKTIIAMVNNIPLSNSHATESQ